MGFGNQSIHAEDIVQWSTQESKLERDTPEWEHMKWQDTHPWSDPVNKYKEEA